MFLDDNPAHTFFGVCIDDACGHDRVHHITSPSFLVFISVFCRESKWCPFFASPPREATSFNYVWIESEGYHIAMGASSMSIFIFSTAESCCTRWAKWHFGISASAHNLWRYM
jgi:hypothetical protein